MTDFTFQLGVVEVRAGDLFVTLTCDGNEDGGEYMVQPLPLGTYSFNELVRGGEVVGIEIIRADLVEEETR